MGDQHLQHDRECILHVQLSSVFTADMFFSHASCRVAVSVDSSKKKAEAQASKRLEKRVKRWKDSNVLWCLRVWCSLGNMNLLEREKFFKLAKIVVAGKKTNFVRFAK